MKPKKRNPIARELRTPQYRKRVEKSPKAYQRRPKHRTNHRDGASSFWALLISASG